MTYRLMRGSRTVFNSRRELFPEVALTESYHTACFDDLTLNLASHITSYRAVGEILNRLAWQDNQDQINYRTIADRVRREGRRISEWVKQKTEEILIQHQFDTESGQPLELAQWEMTLTENQPDAISEKEVNKVVDEYNQGREKEFQIDETHVRETFVPEEHCINVSIDDVCTVEQKPTDRMKNPPPKEARHFVKNTVLHVQAVLQSYILNGLGIRNMLLVLTAFLLNSDMYTNKVIVFFADGASDIKDAIRDVFGWRQYRIILDWYHLKKKCQERLSMALRGREIRNEVLARLLKHLWLGKVEAGIAYLKSLGSDKVRKTDEIDKLIAYFDKNWSYIPCYALRRQLGLRISSNQGEKANDLVVAKRQKHNGMSWSKTGSSGLASVSSMLHNHENEDWIVKRKMSFRLNQVTTDTRSAA